MVKPPDYLKKSGKKFFKEISNTYELEEHHLKILALASQCLDRLDQARSQIESEGIFLKSRFDKLYLNPATKLEKENKVLFARLIRELNLDIELPKGLGRPPSLY